MIRRLRVISSPQSMEEYTGKGSVSAEGREHAKWFVKNVEPVLLKLGLVFDAASSRDSNFTFKLSNAKPGLEEKVVNALKKKFNVTFETGMQNALLIFHMVSSKIEMGGANPYFTVSRWRSGTVTVSTIITHGI